MSGQATITGFNTDNSLYQLDQPARKIRRLHGQAEATIELRADYQWVDYLELVGGIHEGRSVLILWADPIARNATITSPVRAIHRQEDTDE